MYMYLRMCIYIYYAYISSECAQMALKDMQEFLLNEGGKAAVRIMYMYM